MKSGAATYSSAMEKAVNYTRWVLAELSPYCGKSLLEVGLGHGGYRDFLPPSVNTYIGVDIDAAAIASARARYPRDTFFQGDITDPTLVERLAGASIDTILCINVLEHIENDRAAVENMLGLLPQNGYLLLLVPAFQMLYTDMDRLAGHCRRYTWGGLVRLVPLQTSEVVVNEYFNPIGGVGWWLNGLCRHDSLNADVVNGQIVFFDRYVLPFSRLLNPLTKSFFGQSLVCVLRKK